MRKQRTCDDELENIVPSYARHVYFVSKMLMLYRQVLFDSNPERWTIL